MEIFSEFFAGFSAFAHGDAWMSLLTLTALELILGIDNIVFLPTPSGKLPREQQPRIRRIGLSLALILRIALLFGISWIMQLEDPLVTVPVLDKALSGRDLILLGGGLFLLFKATHEIYAKLEVDEHETKARGSGFLPLVIVQIVVIDLVFSLDSIITAVGMTQNLAVMVVAMIIAVSGMMAFAGAVGDFVNKHPSMKILALSYLIPTGALLVGEAFGEHVNRGSMYFAMAFSVGVELINMRVRRGKHAPVELHGPEEQLQG